jgi:hypothetical protein
MSAEDWKVAHRAVHALDQPGAHRDFINLKEDALAALERLEAETKHLCAEVKRLTPYCAGCAKGYPLNTYGDHITPSGGFVMCPSEARITQARREERQRVSDELRRQSCSECANAVLDMGDE